MKQSRAAFLVSFVIAVILFAVFLLIERGTTQESWRSLLEYGVLSALIFILFINLFFLYRNQKTLERKHVESSGIISNLNIGLIEYNDQLNIRYINPKAIELLNLEGRDILGLRMTTDLSKSTPALKMLSWVFYPALADEHHFIPQKARYPQIVEVVFKTPKEMTLSVATMPLIASHGENLGFIKIITDISREKAIAKVKSEFISVTAHQLRTPLAATKWILKMIIDGDAGTVNDEQKDYLRKGYESNERLIRLVNDLLNVARIEEGRFGYHFEISDIIELTKKIVIEFQAETREKKIELIFEEPKDLVPQILMDSQRITLLLQNLIGNAVNYTKAGGKISVAIRLNGGYIECSVKDTGLGIPESQKQRIFSKFFRADNAVHQQTEGTGLGLFIARNIVLRHGGRIWFESEEGKGTTFFFTLPVESEMIPNQELFLEEGM